MTCEGETENLFRDNNMATSLETVTEQGTKAGMQPASADRIPLPRILGYGIGDFGFNFYWFSLQLFLAYYYTDVLGLRSEVAGLIIFLCLAWDGLIDPAIGVLANRTRTRWGKYRPYLLLGSVPLAVSFTLMFAPVGLEGTALIGYAFATQVLFRTMYGLVNIPYSALMATMTRDSMQRNWLAGARMVCAFLGTAVVSYFTPQLVAYFTSGGRTTGYFGATAVLAAIATVFTVMTFAATREDSSITHAQEQPPPLSELLRMLARNVPFLQIIAGIGFFSFANILVTSGLVYYVKYYLGETTAVAGQAASLMQITITVMILPWTIAARYVGKRWAWQAGLAIAFAGLVGLYFSGARDASVLYGYIVVYAIGSASIGVNFWSIVPDTVEYGEWRTGVRAEAFVFGFVTLIQKIALGASSAFLGTYLGWAGYVANQPQTPEAAQAIKLMITLVAAGGLIASAVVMHFYRLDARAHARLVQEITARKLGRESV
jgi:glycoside/pentoside/hexuronide:cation symporter, GPH family